MSEAFDILVDAKVSMAEAEASLTRADNARGDGSRKTFNEQALTAVSETIQRLREMQNVIEHDLYAPASAPQEEHAS